MPTYGDNTTSNNRYFQKGVFVAKAKILSVEDHSNYPKKPGAEIKVSAKNKPRELALKLRVNTGIETDLWVFGSYNWKEDKISGKKLEYLGWKQRDNAVQNLLYVLFGSFDTGAEDSIPQQLLNRMPGQEFYFLKYCQPKENDYEDKPSLKNWSIFKKCYEGADDELYREFLKVSDKLITKKRYDQFHWDDYYENQRQQEASFKPPEEDVI